MSRFVAVMLACGLCHPCLSQEAKPTRDFAAARLQQNPDDVLTLQTYVLLRMRRILAIVEPEPEKADQQLAELRELIDSLEPKSEEAQEILAQAKQSVKAIEQRLKLPRISLEEAAAALRENPADPDAFALYAAKANRDLYYLALHHPDEAEAKIKAAVSLVQESAQAAADEDVKRQYAEAADSLAKTLSAALDRGRELAGTLGKSAAPLDVETWLNGDPITAEEVQGKVVLLDFWAVWCAPCVANLPRLNEWQSKYGEKGLVIVGLTRYHNYSWDEAAERPVESLRAVSAEEEQEMLARFAEHHKMQHRIAIQTGDALEEHYQAATIPHMVLIDRAGKVRLYRVGGSEQDAQEIEAAIRDLLGESAPE
jgi:thiol-disulfide isomerase/thioredoxin